MTKQTPPTMRLFDTLSDLLGLPLVLSRIIVEKLPYFNDHFIYQDEDCSFFRVEGDKIIYLLGGWEEGFYDDPEQPEETPEYTEEEVERWEKPE
jgi:hypothetical protein